MINGSEDISVDRTRNKYAGIKTTFRLSVWVPTESVGKVIGKKGVVITHIQRTTQTEVVVLPIAAEKTPLWCPLSISGEPAKVLNAFNTIRDIVEETDDVVGEFPLPRQKIYHGLFYGNHHEAVKRLSADTNVRINVPDGNFSAASSHITLEGPVEGVFRAFGKFEEVLSDRTYTTYKSVDPPLKLEDGTYQCIVNVPVSIVGLLLVRRGPDSNIVYQIRSATRTHIIKHTDTIKDSADDPKDMGALDAVAGGAGAGEDEEQSSHTCPKKTNGSKGHETFAVRGGKVEDVVLAATSLSRIIDGEKIFSVMHDLRVQRPSSFDRPHNTHDTDSGGRHAGGRGRGDGRGGRGGRGKGRVDDSPPDDGRWGRMRLTSEDSPAEVTRVGGAVPIPSTKPSRKSSKKTTGTAAAGGAATDGTDATDDGSGSGSAVSRSQREFSRGSGKRGGRAGRGSGTVSSDRKRFNSQDRVIGTGGGSGRGGRGESARGPRAGKKGRGEYNVQTDDKSTASL